MFLLNRWPEEIVRAENPNNQVDISLNLVKKRVVIYWHMLTKVVLARFTFFARLFDSPFSLVARPWSFIQKPLLHIKENEKLKFVGTKYH
jgi:hypothetical protein